MHQPFMVRALLLLVLFKVALSTGHGSGHDDVSDHGMSDDSHTDGTPLPPEEILHCEKDECVKLVEQRDDWSYNTMHCWDKQYCDCGGNRQSPIDIHTANVTVNRKTNYLQFARYYPVRDLTVANNGKTLQVTNSDHGYLVFGHDYYFIRQYHLHMPSEHTINGERYYAELQILHQKQHSRGVDDLLAVSILFALGDESPLLKQIMTNRPPEAGKSKDIEQPVDLLRALGPVIDGEFFRYNGSLTAPPCTESVKWFVFETPMTISMRQWNQFKALFPQPANYRWTHPINGRAVWKNSLIAEGEAELPTYDQEFLVTSHRGRNRKSRGEATILWAVFGGLIIAAVSAVASFVREDRHRRDMGNGGLVEIFGKRSMQRI